MGIVDHLKHEGGERIGFAVGPKNLDVRITRIRAFDGGNLGGIRKVFDDAVEQALHADVLQCRAAEDGVAFERDGSLANGGLDLVDRDVVGRLEVRLHERVVEFGGLLNEIGSPELSVIEEVRWNVLLVDLCAELVGVKVVRPHLEQVDDSREVVAASDRDLHRDRIGSEPFFDGLKAVVEIRAELVHLVDEAHSGDVVSVGLSPDGLGLGFDPFLSVKDGHRTIEHSE